MVLDDHRILNNAVKSLSQKNWIGQMKFELAKYLHTKKSQN